MLQAMKFHLKRIDFFIGYEVVSVLSVALVLDKTGNILFCLLASLIHELGHLFFMFIYKLRIKSVTFRLFDILILADRPKSYKSDMIITSGGILFNFLFAFVFYFINYKLFVANLVIGIFNLLPVESLDGAGILSHILLCFFSFNVVNIVIKILSFVFLVPFMLCGIYVLLNTKYNYSLLFISLYVLVILLKK